MPKKRHNYYIELFTERILKQAAKKSNCSKGKIIDLLVKRYLTDRVEIAIEEARNFEKKMIEKHKEIAYLKKLRKEEEDKGKKLKL